MTTPKKFVKFKARDIAGNPVPTPPEFEKLAQMWNAQEGVGDLSCEIEVIVVDEFEDVDVVDDENDDPRGDEQP